MHIYTFEDSACKEILTKIKNRGMDVTSSVRPKVQRIIEQVRKEGDDALLRLTRKFDGHTDIVVAEHDLRSACKRIPGSVYDALIAARKRIVDFHRRQMHTSWMMAGPHDEVLGQMVRPLDRVGIYVPGGKAVYPSSVLMNALPARVAGVTEIIMVTPGGPQGIDPTILAAADLCGIKKVFRIGGAQAVAALAYGTQTVPRVDKIVGPGNIYVATAKKLVYGDVAIDMIAGPSEILIISDGSGNADWAAADLLSQAEHDEMASAILISTSKRFASKVKEALGRRLLMMPRNSIARKSLNQFGAIIVVRDLERAVRLANEIAPEHLELFVKEPWRLLPKIQNAGAVFLGHMTPEAIGDYIAGPNHVLPTGGTARFSSPLSVDDFLKKTSVIACSASTIAEIGPAAIALANAEALDAHASSVQVRIPRAASPRKKR